VGGVPASDGALAKGTGAGLAKGGDLIAKMPRKP